MASHHLYPVLAFEASIPDIAGLHLRASLNKIAYLGK